MAILKIQMTLHDLANSVTDEITADSDTLVILHALRGIASDALPLVASMAPLEGQGRLQVYMEAGRLQAVGDDSTPAAYINMTVCALVDDEIAYAHTDRGSPGYAFYSAVTDGITAVFGELDDPEAYLESVGIDGFAALPEHVKIGSEVVLFA